MESSPAGGENNTPKQQRRGLRCTLSSDVDDPSGLLEPKGNNYFLYTVPSFFYKEGSHLKGSRAESFLQSLAFRGRLQAEGRREGITSF